MKRWIDDPARASKSIKEILEFLYWLRPPMEFMNLFVFVFFFGGGLWPLAAARGSANKERTKTKNKWMNEWNWRIVCEWNWICFAEGKKSWLVNGMNQSILFSRNLSKEIQWNGGAVRCRKRWAKWIQWNKMELNSWSGVAFFFSYCWVMGRRPLSAKPFHSMNFTIHSISAFLVCLLFAPAKRGQPIKESMKKRK